MGLGVPDQRGRSSAIALLAGGVLVPTVEGPDALAARPGRRGAVDRSASAALLFAHDRGARAGLDRPADARRLRRRRRRPARRLRALGAAPPRPDARHDAVPIRRFATGTITITMAFFSMFGMFFVAHAVLPVRAGLQPAAGRRRACSRTPWR